MRNAQGIHRIHHGIWVINVWMVAELKQRDGFVESTNIRLRSIRAATA